MRAEELAWIAQYVDDVECDFLAVYGIADPLTSLPGPRFFQYAARLPHYQGVIRDRAMQELEEEQVDAVGGLEATQAAPPEGGSVERTDNWAAFSLATGVPVERVEVKRSA